MLFLPSFGSRYLKWVVDGIGPAYPVEARVFITILMQCNSLIAVEGEIAAFEIFCLCFKKLKGATVCWYCAIMLERESDQGLSMRNLSRRSCRAAGQRCAVLVAFSSCRCGDGKSVGANQNLLLLCLPLDMYGFGYRRMIHNQFCTFGVYTIYHKFEAIHLHSHLSPVQFSLFLRGLRFILQGFSAYFSAYGQRVYETMKQAWKKLHVSWKCCVVWLVDACVCIFRALHQKHLHIISV